MSVLPSKSSVDSAWRDVDPHADACTHSNVKDDTKRMNKSPMVGLL